MPVSGPEYLKYGGNTTCIEVRDAGDEVIIIDAGTGIRKLGQKLAQERKQAISLVFTHAHWDHILGLPFFKPLFIEGTHIGLYGCPFAQQSVDTMVGRTMAHPNFPVDFSEVKARITSEGTCDGRFRIGSIEITPVAINHPDQGMGYRLTEGDRSFIFITDNELEGNHPGGLDASGYARFCSGADLLLHDAGYTAAEYDSVRGWGHSTYDDALQLAFRAGVKKLGLFHHDPDRTDAALDDIVAGCRRSIRRRGEALDCFAVAEGMETLV